MFRIQINQTFPQHIESVFAALADHESFGKIIGANISRIAISQSEYQNGVGSVRKITPFPTGSFEETVTRYEPNVLIEYKVTKGSPIKDHVGTLQFSVNAKGETELFYTICFTPKLPVPGWGQLLSWIIRNPIEKGLLRYASSK